MTKQLAHFILLPALLMAVAIGCNKAEPVADNDGPGDAPELSITSKPTGDQQPAPIPPPDSATPAEAVQTFLTAVQAGDQRVAEALLTQLANKKMQESNTVVEPPGSPNAKFTVGQVTEIPEQNGAHVVSTWTDFNELGEVQTHEITWVLRKEAPGWRVAGMITRLFDDMPPLVLNFEDPEAMAAAVEAADAELARRAQPPADATVGTQPQGGGNVIPAGGEQPVQPNPLQPGTQPTDGQPFPDNPGIRTATQPQPLQPTFPRQ